MSRSIGRSVGFALSGRRTSAFTAASPALARRGAAEVRLAPAAGEKPHARAFFLAACALRIVPGQLLSLSPLQHSMLTFILKTRFCAGNRVGWERNTGLFGSMIP